MKPSGFLEDGVTERVSLSQPHHIHRGDEQRQGHAAEQGGNNGRVRGGHILRRIDIGKHAAISGNRHGGDDHADARKHAVDRNDEREADKDQRHDDQAQQAHAIQAGVGECGADIAVRQRGTDDHHGHRRIDGADGGQRAFHRGGKPPAGQAEKQRDQRGNHAGIDELPEVDAAVAADQHHAVGEDKKVEYQQEHGEHRHALRAVERLNDRNAHEREVGKHEHQLVKTALRFGRGHDPHEHGGQRNQQREERDAYAQGDDHVAWRAAALQHGRDDAAGERRAQHQRGKTAPKTRRNQPGAGGKIARKHHDEQRDHLENDAGNSHGKYPP